MKRHTYRTILVYAVIILALIQIYPTIGWTFFLNDEQRTARLERWAEEDQEYRRQRPNFFRDLAHDIERWAEFDRDRVINLGLDLQGGIHMVVGFDVTEEQEARGYDAEDVQQLVLQRIRRRIADFEAKEPVIAALGTNQVQIQLPGEKDIRRAERLIMKTAYLTFHTVAGPEETDDILRKIDIEMGNNLVPYLEPTLERGMYEVAPENIDHVRSVFEEAQATEGLVPEDRLILFSAPPNAWEEDPRYTLYVVTKEPEMDGENLASAEAAPDPSRPGGWRIAFEFDGDGRAEFARVTEEHIGQNLAIVLDNVVVSAPVINDRIYGSGEITGTFTQQQAVDLEIALNSGSMPVPIREDYKGVVGPSLGRDSIEKGITSSVVGIAIVAVFMIVYYRVGGVIVNIALILNAILILAALSYFGATLTLPGIAGLILTIGMAVDANVLIFERIREELRNGKSLLASIEGGYSRATITILDANVTTLIAALVLMEFGTGPIEGFAVTLSIGVITSVFTALVVTRSIFDFLSNKEWMQNFTMLSIVKSGTKIRFLEQRRYAGVVSAIFIIAGMGLFIARGSENFGVDFTTGTNMTLALEAEERIPVQGIRQQLLEAGFNSPIVQDYQEAGEETPNWFVVRVGEITEYAEAEGAVENVAQQSVTYRVQQALAPLVGADASVENVRLEKVETVGPAVGRQLQMDALKAISYALMFIIAYLWFRFELKFAVGAVAALVHDILVTIGLFAIFGREITMPVIAALLTIIGYSLNDTIVVFDRVREDLRLYRGRTYSIIDILNISINQTLSRTLLTSLTTLFVVLVLFIFGGSVINDFAFALIVGVLVGTYSSVFVASPVIYLWQKFQGKHIAPTARRRPEEPEDEEAGGEPGASKKKGGKKNRKGGRGKQKSRGATA